METEEHTFKKGFNTSKIKKTKFLEKGIKLTSDFSFSLFLLIDF